MFLAFFEDLRREGIPVTLREYLSLLEALDAGLAGFSVDRFHALARTTLVKRSAHLDRFDRVFARRFRNLAATSKALAGEIPDEWLADLVRRYLSEEERARIGDGATFEEILDELRRRLEEQDDRHEGGTKWIGTGGASRFGRAGRSDAPEGVRFGAAGARGRGRAVKVWEERRFRELDDRRTLGIRNFQVALRRLRLMTREGREEEFDLEGTIDATARSGGRLVPLYRPRKKNRIRVTLLLDVGGSMDPHVRICEELFSAARAEVAHLQAYHFHNCPYETLWKRAQRTPADRVPTDDVIAGVGPHHRLVIVGDASMSPYELLERGGSIEHWNERPGMEWIRKLLDRFRHAVWLNPVAPEEWRYVGTIRAIEELMGGKMFDLSLDGLRRAMAELVGGRR